MNNPIRFEQDPDVPEGTGTFHFSDGSSLYAMQPELAKQLQSRLAAVPDQRTAQNDTAPSVGGGMFSQVNPNGPGARAPAGFGAGSLDPDYSRNLVTDAPGRVGGFQVVTEPEAPKPVAQTAPPAEPVPRKPPPRPMVAGRDPAREAALAVPVPTKTTTTIEGTGAPYSLEDAQMRQGANALVVDAKLAELGAVKARAEEEAARHRAALPSLQRQEAEQRANFDRLHAVYQNERIAVQNHIAEFDKSAKPDPNRFFKNAGTLANIGMAISQALGAYASTITHSENFAAKIVDDALQRDYQEQLDEIREGRVSSNNMLARLADQLGDLDQARTALKLIQGQVLDREIRSFEAAAKSQDASLAAQTWLAQNAQQRLADEQKFRDQSIGKVSTTTSADMVVPRRARPMTDDELIAHQTKQNKARAGLFESENELGYQREGGEQAGKLLKRRAESGANDELYVEGVGFAKTKQEAIALRAATAEYEAREKDLDEMERLNKSASTGVPSIGNLATENNVKAGQLRNRFATSLARSYGGPITEKDFDRALEVTPDPSSWFSGNQQVKIRSAREASRNKLEADRNAIVSGNHPHLPEPRGGSE